MSILKAPPKQRKNATLQLRVDEELKIKLDRYAEFLDSTESYVVSEALKHVFSKDAEFKEWVERQNPEGRESKEPQYPATATEKRADTPIAKPNGKQPLG